MRMEVSPLCPNWRRFRQFHPEALLDGQPVRGCVMADEEAGVVELIARDAEGNVRIDREANDVVYEQRRGKVRIQFVIDQRGLAR